MRHSENEKEAFKRRRKNRAQFQKKKKSALIAEKRNISLGSADYLRLITRKSIILKKNENKGLRKSLN
jgi:hypothetical protein